MNLIFSRILLMKSTNFAKFFIVLAFMLCFCSHIRAEITNGDVQEILTILNHAIWSNDSDLDPTIEQILQSQRDLGNGLGYFLTGYGGPDMDATSYTRKGTLPYMLQLQYAALTGGKLNSANPTTWNLKDDTTSIVNLLRRLTNSITGSGSSALTTNIFNVSVQPTNIINLTTSISPDVLAANPWWSTNSEFAAYWHQWDGLAPRPTSRRWASFPQLMSILSSVLLVPEDATGDANFDFYDRLSAARASWYEQFGVLGDERRNYREGAYSFFDYVADAFRSNWVASGTYNRNLLSSLSSLSSVSNSVSLFNTNIVNLLVTNFPSSFEDILAANPWWATNSAFVREWLNFDAVYPEASGIVPNSLSFPQAFSVLLSTLLPDSMGFLPDTPDYWYGEWQRYGLNGQNHTLYGHSEYRPRLSWFDWVSEAMKSNLVLQVASNYDALTGAVARAYSGTDVEENVSTNSVLASFDDALETPDTSDIQQSFSDTMDVVDAQLRSVSNQFGGDGDPEIVVIPEFTVGGIHVREYRGSLDTSLTRVAHAVCVFLYTVFFICASVRLIRVEWAFWTTLGHSSEA